VAHQLLEQYDVDPGPEPLPPFRELNHVVSLLKGKVQNPQVLYGDIDGLLADLRTGKSAVPMPPALKQLAGITDFRLMVTLTADDLLARALQAAGRGVHEVVHSPKLGEQTRDAVAAASGNGAAMPAGAASHEPSNDLPRLTLQQLAPPEQPPYPPVELLYLFGKSRATPMCAIHDEDVLEYAHNIISNGSQVPAKFMGMLQECSLLLIGCNFPDWLSRFILRATRKVGLSASPYRRELLVERLGSEDPFVGFLKQYSTGTEMLTSIEPTQFVQELRERWDAREAALAQERAQPPSAAVMVAVPASTALAPTERVGPATFFISYSRSTDKASALALRNALLTLGVGEHEIWFDAEEIEPGDDYRRRIFDGIRSCRYFLPLLSQAALQRTEAFVFREWYEANDRSLSMSGTFLVPVVVDADYVPESYKQVSVSAWNDRFVDFSHAPAGQPDGRTLAKLKKLLREARG
jgi:hypothetical protein